MDRQRERGGERERARGKGKTSEKSKTTESSRLPVDSCLSSPLLPPLLRSSTKLRGLVRSFPPTGAQLPYHVTAAATNQSRSQPATMMDSAARMQHVSGATGNHCGRCTNFSLFVRRANTDDSRFRALPSFLPSLFTFTVISSPDRAHSCQFPISLSFLPLPKARSSKTHTRKEKMEEELYDYINPKLREIQTVRASIRTILFNAWTRLCISNGVYMIRTRHDEKKKKHRRTPSV